MEIQKKESYTISLRLFLIGCVLVYLNFLRQTFDQTGQIFGTEIRSISIFIGPFFLILSAITAFMEGQLGRIKPFFQIWIFLIIIYLIFLTISGFFIYGNSYRDLVIDIILYAFFVPAILIGAKKQNWLILDKFILLFFLINLFMLIPYLTSYSSLAAAGRTQIITNDAQIPYFIWGQFSIWMYLCLTLKNRSDIIKFAILAGTIIYFFLAIVFLKRAPFINLSIFFFLFLVSLNLKNSSIISIKIFYLSIPILIFSLLLYSLINVGSFYERFESRFYTSGSIYSSLSSSTRLTYDVELVANQFNNMEFLFGRGLGGSVEDIEYKYPEKNTIRLHNSSVQQVMKGGVVFLFLWVIGFLVILKNFLLNENEEYRKFYIPLLTPFLMSWVFGFLSTSISFLLIMACAGRVMAINNKEQLN